jgi:hypothetical protein
LQAVYRHARSHDTVNVDPTDNLQLPAAGGRRERAATVDEAARLLAALPECDRALWRPRSTPGFVAASCAGSVTRTSTWSRT